jgi:hypothetical protein
MKNIFRMAALGLAVLVGSAGLAAAQDWDHDRDDSRYDRDRDYRYDNVRRGLSVAHENGYRDGLQVAREDTWNRKPYNPDPRGKYKWADHGYSREFGDKNDYRERYADGYRDGYMSAFRGYRGGYDRDDNRGYGYGR